MPRLGKPGSQSIFNRADDLRRMAKDGVIVSDQLAFGLEALERINGDDKVGYYLGSTIGSPFADIVITNELVLENTVAMVTGTQSIWMRNLDISEKEADAMGALISEEMTRLAREQEKALAAALFQQPIYQSPDRRREITGPLDANAAERVWRERNGVILCECDNPDCDAVVEIDHEHYVEASGWGKGWYRVTSPDCGYGVLGARLMQRTEHFLSWTKLE